MTDLEAAGSRLQEMYGPDPTLVGAEDGTEDDFGDLIVDALDALGHDYTELSDEDANHAEDVASACRATTWPEWLAHLEAALR